MTDTPNILRQPATSRATGYSRATLYRLEKKGLFPRRIKLGHGQQGAIGWRAEDINDWLTARENGQSWSPAERG